VKKEPSDKFICLQGHSLLTVIVGIISPQKRNIAILVGKDAVIADGDSVCISAEVLKDTLGSAERRFAIDDPLLFIELFPENIEVAWCLEMTDRTVEHKSAIFETMFEVVKELTAEQRRHYFHVNEEALSAF
jgi:hypothetical protein